MNSRFSQIPSRFRKAITGLVGLGLLAVLAFSFNALFSPRSQQAPRTASQSQDSVSGQLLLNQNDPTEDWQIYTNQAHNLSFRYPQNFSLLECTSDSIILDVQKLTCATGSPPAIEFHGLPEDEQFSLDYYQGKYRDVYETEIVVGKGIKALQGKVIKRQNVTPPAPGPEEFVVTVVTRNDKTYLITLWEMSYKSTYDNLLSTLRF